jgi:hypothetical protein
MSLDVALIEVKETEVYKANITHNLNRMAKEADIYEHLWRPEEILIGEASQLIKPLEEGLELLRSDPERFMKFDAPNGWGVYQNFVKFVREYLEACRESPNAKVRVSR